MGRYRPPAPKSSPYITGAGYQALAEELQALWQRRSGVTKALTAAAAEGDRSENAEYIYRKKELREIDRRIRYLQPTDTDRIFFGATVTVEDADGVQSVYRIVGADEFDPARGWISVDSPLSTALLGKRADDEIRVETPAGIASYCIVDVRY